MKIILPAPLLHHGLKTLPPTLLAMVLLRLLDSDHWARFVATAVLAVLLVVQLILGALHAYAFCTECPKCTPKSSDLLKRPHYRAFAFIGRNGGPPLFVLVTFIALVVAPITSKPATDTGSVLTQNASTFQLATVAVSHLAVAGFLSAARFYRRNHPAGGPALSTRILDHCKQLVHRGHWLVIGNLAVLIGLNFTSLSDAPWPSIRGFVIITYFTAFVFYLRHGRTLCETCSVEFRTDAPEYAEARSWRFTVVHRYAVPIGFSGVALLTTAVFFLDSILYGTLTSIAYVLTGAIVFTIRFHSAYQPWCPYCRNGGRGTKEGDLTPEPTGGHGRPVPAP